MKSSKFILQFLFLMAVCSPLLSCGEESESANVEIVLIPDSPLVSKSNYNIIGSDGEVVEIVGPWFAFSYTIDNGSELPLVVQDFELEVTARANGVNEQLQFFPDFGLFSATRNRITTDPIEPGGTFEETANWPVESLPELASFRYRCKITFFGYFETVDDPDTEDEDESGRPGARFQKSITFTTR